MCDVCGAAFLYAVDLRRHTRIHTGRRDYKCEECSAAFFRLDHLKRHKKSHEVCPDPPPPRLKFSAGPTLGLQVRLNRWRCPFPNMQQYICLGQIFICELTFAVSSASYLAIFLGSLNFGRLGT